MQKSNPRPRAAETPGEFFIDCARRLIAVVQRLTHRRRKYPLHAWAREFSNLRYLDGVPRKKILSTLEFFERAAGGQYIPVVFSGSAFRKKYEQLRAAKRREGEQTPAVPKKIKITPAAYEIQREARYPKWPKGEGRDELQFIQICHDRYSAFHDALFAAARDARAQADKEAARQLAETGGVRSDVDDLAQTLLSVYRALPLPDDYVTEWLLRAHRLAWEWPKWDGKLLKHVWHPRRPPFRSFVERHLLEFSGAPDDWARVISTVEKFGGGGE